MKIYNSYHTSIKQLAKRGNLPQEFSSRINRTRIWGWKKEKEDKYIGTELSNIDLLEQFLERRESETVIRTYLKLTTSFSVLIRGSSQIQKTIAEKQRGICPCNSQIKEEYQPQIYPPALQHLLLCLLPLEKPGT